MSRFRSAHGAAADPTRSTKEIAPIRYLHHSPRVSGDCQHFPDSGPPPGLGLGSCTPPTRCNVDMRLLLQALVQMRRIKSGVRAKTPIPPRCQLLRCALTSIEMIEYRRGGSG